MIVNKTNLIFVIVFLLIGLLASRIFIEKLFTLESFLQFDIIMHLLMILGLLLLMIAFGQKKKKTNV